MTFRNFVFFFATYGKIRKILPIYFRMHYEFHCT